MNREPTYQAYIDPSDMELLRCAMLRQYGRNGAIAPRVMLSRFAEAKKLTVRRCLAMVLHHERTLNEIGG